MLTTRIDYASPMNRQSPLNRGLVLWLLALPQRGKGNTWFDLVGTNHGTLVNTPTWHGRRSLTGSQGSLNLSGTTLRVDTASTAHYDDFSVAWRVIVSTNETNYFVSKWAGGAETSTYNFGADGGGGKSSFTTRTAGGTNETLNTSSNLIRLTGTFHICVTRNATTGLKCIYINGRLDNSATQTTGALKNATTTPHVLGGSAALGTYTGLYDDYRVYDRVLSESEVAGLYREGLTGYPTTLNRIRRYWIGTAGAAAYQLACDAGAYTISGTAVSLQRGIQLACDPGAYTISGTAASIERHYIFDPNAELPPHINIYTINGGEAFLNVGHVFSLDVGAYSISGTSVSLQRGLQLACDAGSCTIAGSDVALETGGNFEIACDAGSYAISGTACSLNASRTLACDAGSYAISGTACTLTVARSLACDIGAYVISGTAVGLEIPGSFVLVCNVGSYVISGTACSLTATRTIACDPGAYALTGTDTGLTIGRTIGCAPGAYLIAGTDCSLEATQQLTLVCDSGAYVISGTSCTLQYSGAGSLRYTLGWISRKTRRVWIAKRHSQF